MKYSAPQAVAEGTANFIGNWNSNEEGEILASPGETLFSSLGSAVPPEASGMMFYAQVLDAEFSNAIVGRIGH